MTLLCRPEAQRACWYAGLLQPLQAELSNSADVLSCSGAREFVEKLARGDPGAASALAQVLGSELTSLLSAPDAFLRCQAIRVSAELVQPLLL
jgi:hypothetical protein